MAGNFLVVALASAVLVTLVLVLGYSLLLQGDVARKHGFDRSLLCGPCRATSVGEWLEARRHSQPGHLLPGGRAPSCATCELWRLPSSDGHGTAAAASEKKRIASDPLATAPLPEPLGQKLPPRQLQRRCTWEPAVTFPKYNSSGPHKVQRLEDCALKCAQNENCNAYTMQLEGEPRAWPASSERLQRVEGKGLCWLKETPLPFALSKRDMRHFKDPLSDAASGECSYVTKLVVNSYVGSPHLPRLFQSLYSLGFRRLSDVIVVLGGAGRAAAPTRVPVRDLVPMEAEEGDVVVVIGVERHNFDLHGFAALFRHRDDPLVAAHGYMYVHCTVTFEPRFPAVFERLNFTDPLVIYGAPCPSSNIFAFGAGVVDAYGSSYEEPIGKMEGLLIEHARGHVRGVKPLSEWGHIVRFGNRSIEGRRADGRIILSYTGFGITKYIKWGPSPPACVQSEGCVTMKNRCISTGRGCKDC